MFSRYFGVSSLELFLKILKLQTAVIKKKIISFFWNHGQTIYFFGFFLASLIVISSSNAALLSLQYQWPLMKSPSGNWLELEGPGQSLTSHWECSFLLPASFSCHSLSPLSSKQYLLVLGNRTPSPRHWITNEIEQGIFWKIQEAAVRT